METVPTLCSKVDVTVWVDDMQGTLQAACSIWWTPVRLQVTGENKRSLCDSAKSLQNIWASVYWLQCSGRFYSHVGCLTWASDHKIKGNINNNEQSVNGNKNVNSLLVSQTRPGSWSRQQIKSCQHFQLFSRSVTQKGRTKRPVHN